MQCPLFVGGTPERRGGLSILQLLVNSGGPVGREQQMLCEGSLGERHLLHVVEFWWGRGTRGEPLLRAGSLGWGWGGSPGLLSGCWQPESPSPARPATGQEGQSSHVRHPAQPFLRQLSGRAARRSQQACCIALAQPSTPGRQSCSLSPECPSCGAARDAQVWGRRGECSAPWVFSLCHVGSGFSVYLGYAAVPDAGSETLPGV